MRYLTYIQNGLSMALQADRPNISQLYSSQVQWPSKLFPILHGISFLVPGSLHVLHMRMSSVEDVAFMAIVKRYQASKLHILFFSLHLSYVVSFIIMVLPL